MSYLSYQKLLKITDGLARNERVLRYVTGIGSGFGVMYEKLCELVAVDQTGADGIYTVRARDLIAFGIGDNISYWDTSAKIQYSEKLVIKSIDRSTNQITTDGKFTADPVTTDFFVLLNTLGSISGQEIEDYIRDLGITDQELDLLGSGKAIRENLNQENAIYPLLSALILALDSHYANGINGFLRDVENPIISTPTNAGNATVDLPNDEAKWFMAGDEVKYYDTSLGYRVLEHLPIASVGAEDSGSMTGTTLITLTGTWTASPAAGDYLQLYDRLAPGFKDVCVNIGSVEIDSSLVFPHETELGTYAATGAAAGTFTDGSAIATTYYGKGDLEVEVINQAIGANNLVLIITAKYYDAAGVEQTDTGATCTIPSTSVVGTRVAVVVGVADVRYHDITAVSNSNGNNGDDIRIVSRLDRLIQRS